MTLIDFERLRRQRLRRRAEGQMAALAFLQDEIAASGFEVAAGLLALAIASIANELGDPADDTPG